MRRIFLICSLALMVLTACTSRPEPVQSAPSSTITTSTATTAQSLPQSPSTAATTTSSCPVWNTKRQVDESAPVQPEIYKVDVDTTNVCYDRVEFTINGTATHVGFVVDWTSAIFTDPGNSRVTIDGNAILQVVIRAPAQGYDMSGHQPGTLLAKVGDPVGAKGRAVRQMKFAGSFESQSTFGVGLDHQRAFRVSTRTEAGYTYVAVDIAMER